MSGFNLIYFAIFILLIIIVIIRFILLRFDLIQQNKKYWGIILNFKSKFFHFNNDQNRDHNQQQLIPLCCMQLKDQTYLKNNSIQDNSKKEEPTANKNLENYNLSQTQSNNKDQIEQNQQNQNDNQNYDIENQSCQQDNINDQILEQSQYQKLQDLESDSSIFIELTEGDKREYKFIRLSKNKIMYVENNEIKYTGSAYQYSVTYDNQNNPNFQIYEGNFINGIKSGKGKLYQGKSRYISKEGTWKDDQYIQEEVVQTKQINKEMLNNRKIIIKDVNGKELEIKKTTITKHSVQLTSWVSYNQQFNQNDVNILKNQRQWLTSSIIDAFVQYLNIQTQNHITSFVSTYKQQKFHLQLTKNEQISPFLNKFQDDQNSKIKQINQYLFCPSSLYTNMTRGMSDKNLNLFQECILEFEPINFNFKYLYSRIYFVINRAKHWFLIYIDFEQNSLNVVDSIMKSIQYYDTEVEIFSKIFNLQFQSINLKHCEQQQNGYDCGPHTCLNMYQDFLKQTQQIEENKKEIRTPKEMRKFLLEILGQ